MNKATVVIAIAIVVGFLTGYFNDVSQNLLNMGVSQDVVDIVNKFFSNATQTIVTIAGVLGVAIPWLNKQKE